ncbi:MAG: hypothetical protein D6722_27045 [Bacteroidetes bacterium]|nr:MAG: hypothetical protein D6722_27045 [Bacteroidota bacterium]
MPDPIKPFIQITEPEPLVIFDQHPDDIEVMVQAKALGTCTVRLHIHADECAFRVEDELAPVVEHQFECQNIFQSTVLKVPFTVVCTNPSDEDILIRFTAEAVNSAEGQSMPTPAFNVDLKPGSPAEENLPSEEIIT